MSTKIIQYEGHDPNTGEARCQIYHPGDRHLYKYASETGLDYAATIQPVAGRTIIMVLAMSASEYYGPNRNGDAFTEGPVKVRDQWAVAPGETLVDYHHTFEELATVYKHHINKDPSNNYGDVMKSFYNPVMHRVELFLSVDNARASDIIGRIGAKEFPGVSMGCRIDYDVCSICGHRAPTTADYCHHVNGLDPMYGMNKLTPEGLRCFVYNPRPRFFDISFVTRPADPIGFMMKKVAYDGGYGLITPSGLLGEKVADLAEKRALLQKVSVIDKLVSGEVVNTSDGVVAPEEQRATLALAAQLRPSLRQTPLADMGTIYGMRHMSLPEFANAFLHLGMMPTAVEIFRLMCAQSDMTPSARVESELCHTQGKVAAVLAETPQVLGMFEDMGLLKLGSEYTTDDAVSRIAHLQEKRSLWQEHLARRHVPESIGPLIGETGAFDADDAYYTPTWQTLTWRDPESGQVYETTRAAAEKADLANEAKRMAELGGVAAGLGAAYKVVTHKVPRAAAPVLLGGAGVLNAVRKQQKVPDIETLEGVAVPLNTELVEKRSSAIRAVGTPLVGGALLTAALLSERAAAEVPDEYKHKFHDAQRTMQNNIPATLLGTTTATAGGLHVLDNLKKIVKRASVCGNTDPHTLEDVDVHEVLSRIGTALLA